jgi:hypothetical protein
MVCYSFTQKINLCRKLLLYRSKLINQILLANSQDEMQTFIYTAITELKKRKVQKYLIRRFIDKTMDNLNDYDLSDNNSQQSANIKMSKNVFNQFKSSI